MKNDGHPFVDTLLPFQEILASHDSRFQPSMGFLRRILAEFSDRDLALEDLCASLSCWQPMPCRSAYMRPSRPLSLRLRSRKWSGLTQHRTRQM